MTNVQFAEAVGGTRNDHHMAAVMSSVKTVVHPLCGVELEIGAPTVRDGTDPEQPAAHVVTGRVARRIGGETAPEHRGAVGVKSPPLRDGVAVRCDRLQIVVSPILVPLDDVPVRKAEVVDGESRLKARVPERTIA